MKKSPILLSTLPATLCAAWIVMAALPACAQTVIDFEDPIYSSGLLRDQDLWSVQRTNELVLTAAEIADNLSIAGLTPDGAVHGGNQAALFSHPGSSGYAIRYIDGMSAARIVNLSVWARPLTPRMDGATNLGNVFVTMENSSGTRAAAFRFGYDTNAGPHIDYATAVGGIWQNSGVPWTSNTWYKLEMTVDYSEKTYDFAINDTQINKSPLAFYSGNNVANLWQVRVFRGSSQAGLILDDLTVTDLTPPGPLVSRVTSTPFGWQFNIADAADGTTPDTNTIRVAVDGAPVTPTSITQSGGIGTGDGTGRTTVAFTSPTPIFVSGSAHTNVVRFEGFGFQPVERTLVFTVPFITDTLDRTRHYPGQFQGKAGYSANRQGRTGAEGDFAADIGSPARQNYGVLATAPDLLTALNSAATADMMSFSLWVRHRVTSSSSVFWAFSATAPDNRGAQMHCPYYADADEALFFDTGGTGEDARITAKMTTFPAYSGLDSWWNQWRHVVAVKNGPSKQIWIDGQPFLSAEGQTFLPYDLTKLYIGCGISGGQPALSIDGWIDDFAVYSAALGSSDVASLFQGTAPDQIPASPSLIAWWDFNDAPSLSSKLVDGQAVITFTQVLQSSTHAAGPYVDMLDAKSPYIVGPSDGPHRFFRTRK